MTITITGPGTFTGPALEPGKYTIEPAESGTNAQNKAFHALVMEYWRSGCHSYRAGSYEQFREYIKRDLGAGFEAYVYAVIENGKASLKYAEKYSDVPEFVKKDPDLKDIIRGRLKSWSDYTKKERRETMDRLISEMHQVGVNSVKFNEILEGMGKLWS